MQTKCTNCGYTLPPNAFSCPKCNAINQAASLDLGRETGYHTKQVTQPQTSSSPIQLPQFTGVSVPAQTIQAMHSGLAFKYGIVSFSDRATVLLPLTPVDQVGTLPTLELAGGTNIVAGLEAAGSMLLQSGAAEKTMIVATDGEATDGGVIKLFGESVSPAEATIAKAEELRNQRIRIACIGISGGTSSYDENCLRKVAGPGLFFNAEEGNMAAAFRKGTRSLTQGTNANNERAFALVMDVSGSMASGTKLKEAQAVLGTVLAELRNL